MIVSYCDNDNDNNDNNDNIDDNNNNQKNIVPLLHPQRVRHVQGRGHTARPHPQQSNYV